ncbi:MAG: glycosyltransferase family 4 protein, partial [Rhodothermales bacterium]
MKILFCSPCSLDRTLGAAQTLMDLAEELEKRGWECDLVGPEQIDAQKADYPEKLYAYLKKHAHQYDIVDFDYTRFALHRRTFNDSTLFVARCQLLRHHLLNVQIPPTPVLRSRLRALLLGPYDRRRLQTLVWQNTATLKEADLVIVLNERDAHELGKHGIPASNIRVIPNGMTEERHRAFGAVPVAPPEGAIIAFIGMYGPRKGAADFPDLVRRVTEAVPEARFRLLGTRGAYKTAEEVRALFPSTLRKYIEVIPSFAPEALPGLLAPCSVGVF